MCSNHKDVVWFDAELAEGCVTHPRAVNTSGQSTQPKEVHQLAQEASQLDCAADQASGTTRDAAHEAAESAQTLLRWLRSCCQ